MLKSHPMNTPISKGHLKRSLYAYLDKASGTSDAGMKELLAAAPLKDSYIRETLRILKRRYGNTPRYQLLMALGQAKLGYKL